MKKRNETPRMLKHVVQAITTLKDVNGSTTKRILDKIHTALSNAKPKPRNVVMQVKKALKHALTKGVLKHKAGKYRLNLSEELNTKKKGRKRIKKTNKNKTKKLPAKPMKRLFEARESVSATSTASEVSTASSGSSISSRSRTEESVTSDYDKESRSLRRRRRSIAKKNVAISRDSKKKKRKGILRRPRKQTPMPKIDKCEETATAQELSEQIQNLENMENTPRIEENADTFNSDNFEPLTIEEIPPMCCGNPDCLCNVKQEPSDANDGNYDEQMVCDNICNNNDNDIDNDNPDDVSDIQGV